MIDELCGITAERIALWKGRTVLVTGATGMLGSWMTRALVRAGADVVILVRDWMNHSLLYQGETLDRVTIVPGRLEDYDLMLRLMQKYRVEYVFHIGAQTQVRHAVANPRETFESNIRGTWNLLEACRLTPTVKGVLVASSDKAYGSQPTLPYTEDAPLHGEYPYDVSKSCADLLARSYFLTYGLPVCVTRCGNLYGPGDNNYDRIIPGTVRSVLRGERPVIRSDGLFVRDYFFTPDAVDGYLTIAENIHRPDIVGEAFNLSTENKVTVLDLFNRILRLLGSDAQPLILNQASNEIREQYLSAHKAQRLLAWTPKHDLDAGLAITVAWYRELLSGQAASQRLISPS